MTGCGWPPRAADFAIFVLNAREHSGIIMAREDAKLNNTTNTLVPPY
jgi:hypothetical protein